MLLCIFALLQDVTNTCQLLIGKRMTLGIKSQWCCSETLYRFLWSGCLVPSLERVVNVVPFDEKVNVFNFRKSAFQAIARREFWSRLDYLASFPHSTPERLTASRLTCCAVTFNAQ